MQGQGRWGTIGTSVLAAVALVVAVLGLVTQPAGLDVEQQSLSGYALRLEDGTGSEIFSVTDAGAVDAAGALEYGADGVSPLGYATSGYAVYCGQVTVTGTLVVTEATHGLTTPTVVIESMASAPGATAGDPFTAYSIWSGATVTLTVAQDDGSAATDGATIDYCIVGVD